MKNKLTDLLSRAVYKLEEYRPDMVEDNDLDELIKEINTELDQKAPATNPDADPVLIRAIIDNSEGNPDNLTERDEAAIKDFLTYNWNGPESDLFQVIVDTFNELYHTWKDEMVQLAVSSHLKTY